MSSCYVGSLYSRDGKCETVVAKVIYCLLDHGIITGTTFLEEVSCIQLVNVINQSGLLRKAYQVRKSSEATSSGRTVALNSLQTYTLCQTMKIFLYAQRIQLMQPNISDKYLAFLISNRMMLRLFETLEDRFN
ncbi:uncharacterized protein EV154DRAFT_482190 [Mucor mucedo]|uniref:uncharacterized protein n=1 Tax=Mucor mucedo TaxID=29922 RepID=UPI00222118A2|nr:uncharacterized protein EV154DRAFT_482190 [Mucor mucedo]KAI7890463.1 hypothetical protein EV154DRAFT_482190 [Mucor mucedo]